MRLKTLFPMAALAVALFAAGNTAQASFDYTVDPILAPATAGGGAYGFNSTGMIVNNGGTLLAGVTGSGTALNTPTDIIIANPTFSSTVTSSPPPTVTFNYGYQLTITSPSGPGNPAGVFDVYGTISGPGSATQSSLRNTVARVAKAGSSNGSGTGAGPSASVTIGGTIFTVTPLIGTAPQAGSPPTQGALLVHVDTTAVPEPASVALLGIGGVGALGLFYRRRQAVKV